MDIAEISDNPRLAAWYAEAARGLAADALAKMHGDMVRWLRVLDLLAAADRQGPTVVDGYVCGGVERDVAEQERIREQLFMLHPWRKGPFRLCGVPIETEWRSDLKWDRVVPHIAPLAGRVVCDIGCGSGYHLWRMVEAGARGAIGIEPYALSVVQFLVVQQVCCARPVSVLPARLEAVPPNLQAFDTVFSMGLLYHTRSPFDHLAQCKGLMKPGGELVLETLVIHGDKGAVLVPRERYAKMNNVWFIPTPATLCAWLERAGFVDIRHVDTTRTTGDEQRKTDWMTFESLDDFLDPADRNLTVEGYPAPHRAIFVMRKPA